MKRPDMFDGLRFYPAFLLVALVLGVGLSVLFQATITRAWLHQRLVPRWQPVTMAPGDRIEVGSHGSDRPVLVRHADGSVTNAGQIRGWVEWVCSTPSFLASAIVWFAALWFLARVWPRCPEPPQGFPVAPVRRGGGTAAEGT